MSVPVASVRSLLENLAQILIAGDDSLEGDARESFEDLRQELLNLQSLMVDSLFIDGTAKEMGNLLFEAEDLVDTYMLHAATPASRRWISRSFSPISDHPARLRNLSKAINAKVKQIQEDVCQVKASGSELQQYQATMDEQHPDQAHQVGKHDVIGFDDATYHVSCLLLQGVERFKVVSIVGMLGLGKTTLAKKVFMDPDVDYEYMIRVFIYISQYYDKREVLLKILTSISVTNEQVVGNMNDQQLEKHVYRELEGKQYLVVLDDVWEKQDWDELKSVFPNNQKRCRVLLTTRNVELAEYANQDLDFLYRLNFLSLEDSRKLLRWRVFHQDEMDESHTDLLRYEIEIAAKCGGLPFVLVLVAGILLNHPHNVRWWEDVANSLNDYIARDVRQSDTMIRFMYKHYLPYHLKPCFLYLGVFPEDSNISVWKLVRLWISEGFIPWGGEITLEDLAEQYLKELVRRNLVLVVQLRKDGRMKTCRMHPTLREFCQRECATDNLFQEIKKTTMINGDVTYLDEYRRLISNNPVFMEFISETPIGKRVRSFLTFPKEECHVDVELVSCIPKTFKLLRVLEVQSLIFDRFPADMCNLALLKYVAISSTFSLIPAPMSALSNLQTLIVITTSDTLDIKADLWKMPHFRHLHTNASATLPTSSNPKGTCIQTLCRISPESCTEEVFELAPELKKLGIYGTLAKLFEEEEEGISRFLPQLCRFEALENLKLLNEGTSSKMYSLPKEFPRRLKKLTLKNTRLGWREMSTIGKLEGLEVLKLREYAFQGSLWYVEDAGFSSLRHLFVGPTDVVVWEAGKDQFPKLESLELNGCSKLQSFPHRLSDIPSLQIVVLHCVNPMVASSARRLQVLRLEQAKRGCQNTFSLSVYPPGH